ncbi:type II 3-dehydroquinate dehydratase [Desulfococcaceae bacterium HSG9]|nr:type II 3-dehydroquinate dehydratase [Desulfococcaceae bacterium HSG9]
MSENKKMPLNVLVLHGPNLNLLGTREPDVYGSDTLKSVNAALKEQGRTLGITVNTFQSNYEGVLVEKIQASIGVQDGLIINPAAYTHTSVAIRDALLMLKPEIPIIEIHLSNIYKRESFRHRSMIADVVTGQISGLGVIGYTLALTALDQFIRL